MNLSYIVVVRGPAWPAIVVWSGDRFDKAKKVVLVCKEIYRTPYKSNSFFKRGEFVSGYSSLSTPIEWFGETPPTNLLSKGKIHLVLLEEDMDISGGYYGTSSTKPPADHSNFLHVGRDNSYFLEKYIQERVL